MHFESKVLRALCRVSSYPYSRFCNKLIAGVLRESCAIVVDRCHVNEEKNNLYRSLDIWSANLHFEGQVFHTLADDTLDVGFHHILALFQILQ